MRAGVVEGEPNEPAAASGWVCGGLRPFACAVGGRGLSARERLPQQKIQPEGSVRAGVVEGGAEIGFSANLSEK